MDYNESDKFINNSNNEQETDEYHLVKNSVGRNRRERKIRKAKRRANRFRKFLRFIISIGLLVLSYYFFMLPQWYLPKDAFKNPSLERVEIYNNKIIPTPVIYDAIKKVPVTRKPIFLMSSKKLQKAVYSIPVVKNVYIRRYGFPARVQIIIKERMPIAIFKVDLKDKPIAFYTSDGVLVTNKKYMVLADSEDILKILTTNQALHKKFDIAYIHEIQQVVSEVEKYSKQKVQYIDLRNQNDVYVKIKTTTIRIGMLDSSLYDRIARIYTILPQISNSDEEIKYIDLSWDKVNYLKLNKKAN